MKNTHLTEHFTLRELTSSATAARLHIDNTPDEWQLRNLRMLCTHVLEPLRQAFDRPIYINSAFRSPELNRAVGGAPHSQHMRGQAADIHVNSHAQLVAFSRYIEQHCLFDQMILERAAGVEWLHVSLVMPGRNRKTALRYV